MREAFVFGALERNRERLLNLVETCPEDKRDVIPAGFKNNLHWHLGHILFVTDAIVHGFTGGEGKFAAYKTFFGNGTKPADWTDGIPAWDAVIAQLKEQPAQIQAEFAGKLENSVHENFLKAETVGELLLSTLLHETGHMGNINAMLKLLV